jgi:hypothetical protein
MECIKYHRDYWAIAVKELARMAQSFAALKPWPAVELTVDGAIIGFIEIYWVYVWLGRVLVLYAPLLGKWDWGRQGLVDLPYFFLYQKRLRPKPRY